MAIFIMNNEKWPPSRMEIRIFVDKKQVIKFAWPKHSVHASSYCDLMYFILYFAWEDSSDAVHCIVRTVLIRCITVLYESYSTVSA